MRKLSRLWVQKSIVTSNRFFSSAQNTVYVGPTAILPLQASPVFNISSTDVINSNLLPERIRALQLAFGFSNQGYITTYCTSPKSTLFHCCLVAVECCVIINDLQETSRGTAIFKLANDIFEKVKPEFMRALEAGKLDRMKTTLAEKLQREEVFLKQFVAMHNHVNPYNHSQLLTPTSRNRNVIVKCYLKLKERIRRGDYTLKNGESAESLTWDWYRAAIEHRHLREIGNRLARAYIRDNTPASQKLTLFPKKGLVGYIYCGGMGSGKSVLSRSHLKKLPEEERYNRVLHDADYLKIALSNQAGTGNEGSEVQAESSNTLYETMLQRRYTAATIGKSPKVVVNSVCINSPEVDEIMSGGGKVHVYHISFDPQKAINACKERAKKELRNPPIQAIIDSNIASSKSVLDALTQYRGKELTIDVMERNDGEFHEHARISCIDATIYVADMPGFLRVAERASLGSTPKESRLLFMKSIALAGYTIRGSMEHYLLSKQGDNARAELETAETMGSRLSA